MSTRSFKLTIFHKLLLTLLAVSLIPLLGVWYAGSSQAREDARKSVSQHLMMTASNIATGINTWDDANLRALQSAARFDDIIGMDPAKQTPILRAMGDTYEWAFVVFTIEPTGDNIARSDDKPLTKFGDRAYFKESMKGATSARQVLISKSTGKPALTLGVPIKNAMGGPVGVLAMEMIASGRPDKSKDAVQDMGDYPALKIDGISESPTVYTSNGKHMVGYLRKLPQGWTLLVEQEYDEAYASLARLENGARLLILLTGAFVFGVAWFLGKQLTRPINQLILVAEHLSTGNFEDDIPGTERGDEIGALARAVERLGVSIRMAMERLRRKA